MKTSQIKNAIIKKVGHIFLTILFIFGASNASKACSPLNPPALVGMTVTATTVFMNWQSNTPWHCPDNIVVEIACNNGAFSGLAAFCYTSATITGTTGTYGYPTMSIPIATLCPGTTYKFRAMEINNGCCGTSIWTVTATFTTQGVYVPPTINVAATPTAFCPPQTIALTSTINNTCGGAGIKYAWTPAGILNNATIAAPTASPLVSTTFTLNATGGQLGCWTASAQVSVVKSVPPTGTIAVTPSTMCPGGTATLSIVGTTASVQWQSSNNANGPWVSIPNATTNVQVCTGIGVTTYYQCVVTGCSSINTNTVFVTVYPNPVFNFINTNEPCFGNSLGTSSVNVTVGTGPFVYQWSNGGSTALVSGLSASPTGYSCVVTDAHGCFAMNTTTITQPPALSLTINSSTTNICALKTINLNSFGSGGTGPYTYTWNPGPQTQASNVTQTVAGTYNYVLNITDANGCLQSSNINLTWNAIPLINVTSDSICFGDKGVLFANGAETYNWSPVNSTGSTFTTTGSNSLFLTIVGTNTSTGCSSLPVTSTLVVMPLPTPVIANSNNKGCVPLCMTFTCGNTGAGNISSSTWDFGDGGFATNVTTTDRCFTIAGDYTTKLTLTDVYGCVNTTTTNIYGYSIPTADFNYSPIKPIVNQDAEVVFTDASFGGNVKVWDWYFMNLPKPHSNYQNPTFVYTDPGQYSIALVIKTDHGCMDTIVKTIIVGEDYGIFVPNIFSPNGDGVNDVFQPKGFGITKYELRLFTRGGEELMFTNDFAHGWDGMYKGKLSQEGTYVWKINLTNVFGKSHELSGHVTLIK